jgi:hypothetical protein
MKSARQHSKLAGTKLNAAVKRSSGQMLSGSQRFTEKGGPKPAVSTLITARHRVVTSFVFLCGAG